MIQGLNGLYFSGVTDKVIPAFIKFQSELEFANKSANNPFFNSKYADLKEVWAVIKKPLENNKLALVQWPEFTEYVDVAQAERKIYNGKLVRTGNWINVKIREIIVHSMIIHESGQWVACDYIATPDGNDHQQRGSAITYARRYSIMPLCGVCPEDDDGNPHKNTSSNVPSKTHKDDLIVDSSGTWRYNKTLKVLNDNYQNQNSLIDNSDLNVLMNAIQQRLGGNFNKFLNFLFAEYSVKNWYDIPKSVFPKIIEAIKTRSDFIMSL